MATSKQRVKGVTDTNYETLADEQIAELYQGAPEMFSEPKAESPHTESENSGPEKALLNTPADKVLLRNIRHINETVFIPVNGEIVPGHYVRFVDGTLITTREKADFVKSICPHVYEEPREGPIFSYQGFHTRVPEVYQQWVSYYHENNG